MNYILHDFFGDVAFAIAKTPQKFHRGSDYKMRDSCKEAIAEIDCF